MRTLNWLVEASQMLSEPGYFLFPILRTLGESVGRIGAGSFASAKSCAIKECHCMQSRTQNNARSMLHALHIMQPTQLTLYTLYRVH